MPPILFLATADLYSSFSSSVLLLLFSFCFIWPLNTATSQGYDRHYVCKRATQVMQPERKGATRNQNGSESTVSGLQIARQLCTLNVREGEEKYHRKASRKIKTSSQQCPPFYIKAVSKTNKKQLPRVSNWTTWCLSRLQKAMHLLACMSCPFCLQKTLVTFPTARQIMTFLQGFPDPLSHLTIRHLSAT